jgi:hypothetical protein
MTYLMEYLFSDDFIRQEGTSQRISTARMVAYSNAGEAS